jgi:hypothetical protein
LAGFFLAPKTARRAGPKERNTRQVQVNVHLIDPAWRSGCHRWGNRHRLAGRTIAALAILFAIYAFIGAGLQVMRAFSSRTAGPVLGHLLLALIDVAAGIVALVWPGPTALVLVVAIWALAAGFAEIFAAFGSSQRARRQRSSREPLRRVRFHERSRHLHATPRQSGPGRTAGRRRGCRDPP